MSFVSDLGHCIDCLCLNSQVAPSVAVRAYRPFRRWVVISFRNLHEAVPVRPTNYFSVTQPMAFFFHSPMSQAYPMPSPDFQLIFDNALKTCEKRTGCRLLTFPLAAHLQTCDSPTAILNVLHQRVQAPHQSQRAYERLTKWLNPTVNVIFAFSADPGEGASMVCPCT